MTLGTDTGFDTIGNFEMARPLAVFLDRLGREVESGELPDDLELLDDLVKDICYYNAVNYFGFT